MAVVVVVVVVFVVVVVPEAVCLFPCRFGTTTKKLSG